jgi:hypothetical protein
LVMYLVVMRLDLSIGWDAALAAAVGSTISKR